MLGRAAALIVVAACTSNSPRAGVGGAIDAGTPTENSPLGMNDVTMLLPLPVTIASPTLLAMTADGTDLVPRDLFTRLVTTPGDVANTYAQFQLVALRFDLCDRTAPGACPVGSDGRLRLVFQPLFESPTQAFDVALHAFYPIPAADLASVIDELRALAAMQALPTTSPLIVKPAMANDYATRLQQLIVRYAVSNRLIRLTLFAQNAQAAAFTWAFRGVELDGTQYIDMSIPTISATQQRAILVGSDPGYDVTPVADAPAGLATALSSQAFGEGSSVVRLGALGALAAAQNPQMNTAQTIQCIACHISTYLTAHRAATAGIDPASVANRYTSTFDLSISSGMSATNEHSLRALGWLLDKPEISQRVANDTAEVLSEIAQQFPPR